MYKAFTDKKTSFKTFATENLSQNFYQPHSAANVALSASLPSSSFVPTLNPIRNPLVLIDLNINILQENMHVNLVHAAFSQWENLSTLQSIVNGTKKIIYTVLFIWN